MTDLNGTELSFSHSLRLPSSPPYYSEILALLLCNPKAALPSSSLAAMGAVRVIFFLAVALTAAAGGGDAPIMERTFALLAT